jgi:hypothetical protein
MAKSNTNGTTERRSPNDLDWNNSTKRQRDINKSWLSQSSQKPQAGSSAQAGSSTNAKCTLPRGSTHISQSVKVVALWLCCFPHTSTELAEQWTHARRRPVKSVSLFHYKLL